jgi:hypothetical protein
VEYGALEETGHHETGVKSFIHIASTMNLNGLPAIFRDAVTTPCNGGELPKGRPRACARGGVRSTE